MEDIETVEIDDVIVNCRLRRDELNSVMTADVDGCVQRRVASFILSITSINTNHVTQHRPDFNYVITPLLPVLTPVLSPLLPVLTPVLLVLTPVLPVLTPVLPVLTPVLSPILPIRLTLAAYSAAGDVQIVHHRPQMPTRSSSTIPVRTVYTSLHQRWTSFPAFSNIWQSARAKDVNVNIRTSQFRRLRT